MREDIWFRCSLWQRISGTSHFRSELLDLLKSYPGRSWRELKDCASERGWELCDPLDILPAEEIIKNKKSMQSSLQKGWHLLTPMDESYPETLMRGMDSPLAISVCGDPTVLHKPCLSVVGSREPTSESLLWMEEHLSEFVKKTKTVIVSGGARGVDQKAHSVALRNGSPTIAFLPSGLDTIYPGEFAQWTDAILERGGALVSEYPANLRMSRQNFHQRNRLIAAQGTATLIVQARQRSGTYMTANRAAEIGRPLWVVPGHPQSPNYSGNIKLLIEGASLVSECEDLIYFWQAELS